MFGGVERSLTPGTAILLVGIAVTAVLNARWVACALVMAILVYIANNVLGECSLHSPTA